MNNCKEQSPYLSVYRNEFPSFIRFLSFFRCLLYCSRISRKSVRHGTALITNPSTSRTVVPAMVDSPCTSRRRPECISTMYRVWMFRFHRFVLYCQRKRGGCIHSQDTNNVTVKKIAVFTAVSVCYIHKESIRVISKSCRC